ncbi:MAG: tyrosine recombinase XerC [Endomicrobiaceae bacterium]|nr:tyrosine recombinase XerC [Endomicrobiaceae bacterium]
MDKTRSDSEESCKENNEESCQKKEIKQFIQYLQAERNYSQNTARAYYIDMYDFTKFLKDVHNDIELTKCTKNIVRDYLVFLYDRKLKKASIIRKFAVLKSFYKFLVINNLIDINPIASMSSPKKEKRIPVFLTEQEIHKLFDLPDIDCRDRAMLELLYSSGIRIEELVSTNLKDIDLLSGTVKVFGKGSSERIVPVGDMCLIAIKNYIDQRRKVGQECKINSPMFLNRFGKRITSRGARKVLHGWFIKAGYIQKVSPHTLRHTFATHILDRGCDIRSVQKMLGHKNLSTTQIYTHVTLESLRKIYNKTHPRV